MKINRIIIFGALFASILTNIYLYCESRKMESTNFSQKVFELIRHMKPVTSDDKAGYYLGSDRNNWPPYNSEFLNGILLWEFMSNGNARYISIGAVQKWKYENGGIYFKYQSEEYKYYGRLDSERLTLDHGDYEDFYFKAK